MTYSHVWCLDDESRKDGLGQVLLLLYVVSVAASLNSSLPEPTDFIASSQGYQAAFKEAHTDAVRCLMS